MAIFRKGDLVLLGGLQSETGLALNGGQGIIMDDEILDGRYKVRVYAIPKSQLKRPPTSEDDSAELEVAILADKHLQILSDSPQKQMKQIKEKNLKSYPKPKFNRVFTEAARQLFQRAESKKDGKEMLFWSWACYKNQPAQIQFGIDYANALRKFEKEYKKATSIIHEIFEKVRVTKISRDPKSIPWLRDAVMAYCASVEHLDDAIKYAHLIPTDTATHNAMARESLRELVKVTDITLTANYYWGKFAPLAKMKVAALKTLHEREPSFTSARLLAGAHCLAEDWMEGIKLYRKILQRGADFLPPDMVKDLQTSLIEAQLHCKGMALEHFTNVGRTTSPPCWWIFPNENRDKMNISSKSGGVKAYFLKSDPCLIQYVPPSDPDHPQFGPLLELLKQDERQPAQSEDPGDFVGVPPVSKEEEKRQIEDLIREQESMSLDS
mmetsp:Transcript_25567/g.62753  ORF Transcript_25567/g.62753 Transcript_25567/m.62753 type:complete len:438 (-) Transcript_25567:343-1656(-)